MQKVMVIGCCGAGKSIFSKQLHQLTGLELIHLDQYYWKPNWTETTPNEWEPIVQRLANKPQWIIDGNYKGTLDIRIQEADTIIYLDYPTWICLSRVLKRTVIYWRQKRPDMANDCKERFSLGFLHYVLTFNKTRRPALLKKLQFVEGQKNIHIFKNDAATKRFLENLMS